MRAGLDLSDLRAFREAYAAHHRGAYAAAFAVLGDAGLAQDAVQDVFLRVWRRPGTYDARRGELGSFLRLMARSRALDLWRETQVRDRAADRLKLLTGSGEGRHEEPDGGELRAAVARLPAAQREALALTYWAGMTADQVARHAQVPLGTAKSRIRLGLARLRDELPIAA